MAPSTELPTLELEDGTPVRFLLAEPTVVAVGGRTPDPDAPDLPDGMGAAVAVSRGGQAVAALATGALHQALRPLGTLIEEVHGVVTGTPVPPSEISVSFGLQIGGDLKLGIVGATGQAHLNVTATWAPAPSSG
ncbi:CU044_2847 family protein [Streptomyces sp. NPDC001904]|uniref:CU044_2847 family protein n=1 Tax=Streptomyces sp. NPDC001904 TaxID=3154531 RepID=UPI003317A68E